MQEVFLEALNFDNFKLINKIITLVDDRSKLINLNNLLEDKFLELKNRLLYMTNSETPEMPKSLVLNILEINNNGENILHIMASEANSDKEKLAKYKDIIDERKNADFITHLLHSENKQGKTPLEIARENNNQDFIDIFDGKPYAILSEIKSYQKLIKEKVNHKSCEVM